MSKKIVSEPLYRIHYDNTVLEVGECADVPGLVALRTPNQASIEYWGSIAISMDPEMATKLGQALIDIAYKLSKP